MTTATATIEAKAGKGVKADEWTPAAVGVVAVEMAAVKISDIVIDEENHRINGPLDEKKIEELVSMLEHDSQLQPIRLMRVVRDGKTSMHLVFGFRRIEAAKRLKWTYIRAEIVAEMERVLAVRARAVENLGRDDLNELEEAVMVTHMGVAVSNAAAVKGDKLTEQQVCERVAKHLGKSPAWVRDRKYLSRFAATSKAYQLILAGKLPLQHAREIAKLVDPQVRDEVAVAVTTPRWPGQAVPLPIEQVRAKCNELANVLRQATWRLDVAFADAPACNACPSNTANDVHLFEHDDAHLRKEASGGLCMNAKCFARKAEETEKLNKAAAAKVVKEVAEAPKGEKSLNVKALEAKAPPTSRPESFAHQAVEAIAKKPVKAKTKKLAPKDLEASAKFKAESELERVKEERAGKIRTLVMDAVNGKPGRMAAFSLLMEQRETGAAFTYQPTDKHVKNMQTPAAVKLFRITGEPTLAGIATLEKGVIGPEHGVLARLDDASPEFVELVAHAWKLKVPPVPKLEEFMPKAEAAEKWSPPVKGKAAAKKPAKGKAVKKAKKKK